MVVPLLPEKYETEMCGVLNCYDRVVISGNLHPFCYAKGMTGYLYTQEIRIFDYVKFAEPLRQALRENAEAIAKENGLEIEFIRKPKAFRKEKQVKKIIRERGSHPGLVHIFSAMEQCQAYHPWHNKETHKTYLKAGTGKCLHYYFYFIDPEYGLCYLRVPTWVPFRLQCYFNGHNALAAQLKKADIDFKQVDNAFLHLANFEKANELSASLDTEALHRKLNQLAQQYCPVVKELDVQ